LDRKLPRGRNAVAREAVAGEHRERILAAVALLARTKGYTAMTVADIVSTGSVTREVFYELFKSKEDAFLATQSAGLERSISVTAAGFFAGENWPMRVWDGLEALLGFVALQPDLVYLDVIESFAVGAASLHRSFDNKMAYTLFLEDGYRQRPEAERLPRLCSEAIGGAILGLLRWQVGEGKTEQMLEVLPQASYLALAPFIGAPAAMEFVEARVAEAGAETI
jgi:AcrR family transcriptional regulator